MRIDLPKILCALCVASSALAQDSALPVLDGSAPGKALLVLRELPPGKPALIVREPPNSNGNGRQRSIIFFSPRGTAAELVMAYAAFDRIRREDGEVITRLRREDNIGTPRPGHGKPGGPPDAAMDSATKVSMDVLLGAMQSTNDFVRAVPESVVPGVGKVHWIQIDRPPVVKSQR